MDISFCFCKSGEDADRVSKHTVFIRYAAEDICAVIINTSLKEVLSFDNMNCKYDLIKEESIRKALMADLGVEPQGKISWTTEEFTKIGDNYSCKVTRLLISWDENEVEKSHSYVVKIKQDLKPGVFTNLMLHTYNTETLVLKEIMPAIDTVMMEAGLERTKTPKAFYLNPEEDGHFVIMEDLVKEGFKMVNKLDGLDEAHAWLVMQELGRLHAASRLFETKMSNSVDKLYPGIIEPWMDRNDEGSQAYTALAKSNGVRSKRLIQKVPGYEHAVEWLDWFDKEGIDMFYEHMNPNVPIYAFNHGDCWSNNILFKYDSEGKVVDVRLVDLQVCRKASPVCDILYMMFSSMTGKDRTAFKDNLLRAYYQSFSDTCLAGGHTPYYTLQDIQNEYDKRIDIGIYFGILLVSNVLTEENDEVMEFKATPEEFERQSDEMFNQLFKSKVFSNRFLTLFDHLKKT